MKWSAPIANTLWWASNLPAWRSFRDALSDPATAQSRVLHRTLKSAAASAFGRKHQFEKIDNIANYREKVPVCQHEAIEPWIERIRNGEQNVLTSEVVTRLATTSGSTKARKLIPYTRSLQAEFNRAIGPWIVDLVHSFPKILGGPAYWSISPIAQSPTEASKVPIGFEEDSEYLGGIRRHLVDAVMAVPASVRRLSTIDAWREQTVAHLRAARDLRLISVWHPSFLTLLLDAMSEDPRRLWPNLQIISCWADGHANGAAAELSKRFPGVVIQPKGLIATEGIVSIPFEGQWPLAITSHFFEFLRDDGQVVLAHELDVGGEYEVIITTSGGLYRYRLGDRVRVGGIVRRTPSIRLLGRAGAVSDRFGEKLSEAFVAGVINQLMEPLPTRWAFSMLAPEGSRYVLYVEGDVSAVRAEQLDTMLCQNPHYSYCRQIGQLQQACVCRIVQHATESYFARLERRGMRRGDIKPTALSLTDGWVSYFECALPEPSA